LKAANNAAHHISALDLASAVERGNWGPIQDIREASPQNTDFSGLSRGISFCSPRPDSDVPFDSSPLPLASLGDFEK